MASSALIDLLGSKLLKDKDTEVSTGEALAGKTAIALYFSAHWCPPCRQFTPMLAKQYKEHLKDKGLEVVFVSSDRDQAGFDSYYGDEHPWLALPFADRAKKAALSKKYKVQGIPTLVIVDGATGETITTEGREAFSNDPTGTNLPWRPPTFWEALGDEFLQGSDGDTVDLEEVKSKSKVIGLYFSAHWCPPCRGFTPNLVKAYNSHLKAKGLEIIFVSSDRDASSFLEYYSTMPWLAIPQGDKRKEKLSSRFGVQGIPSFVLVDAQTGETISTQARGNIDSDPTGEEFPWHPKPLNDLEAGPEGINEETALCVLLDACDDETAKKAKSLLETVAAEGKAKAKAGEGPEMLYFYSSKAGQVTNQIRQLTKAGEGAGSNKPVMIILDIPDNGGYYKSPAEEVTAETVGAFLEAYKSQALERLQLS